MMDYYETNWYCKYCKGCEAVENNEADCLMELEEEV